MKWLTSVFMAKRELNGQDKIRLKYGNGNGTGNGKDRGGGG